MTYTGINEWRNYWEYCEIAGSPNGKIELNGISAHVDKLPKAINKNIGNCSYALCADTGDVYFYSKELDEWILQ